MSGERIAVPTEMTPRERFLCALRLQEPDRVPYFDYGIDERVVQAIAGRKLAAKEVGRQFGRVDLEFWKKPPVFSNERYDPDSGRTFTGDGLIRTRADLRLMEFPPPATNQELEAAARFLEEKDEFAAALVIDTGPNPTLLSMGYDGFSYALHDDPGLILEIMKRYVDWTLSVLDAFGSMGFDFILSGDDIAFNSGPFCSPAAFRDVFIPGMTQVAEAIHLPWVFHSDGDLMPILEDLLDLGINGLNPIQPEAMDIFELKRQYGHRLCLVGNFDINVLSFGTVDDAREEVRHKIETLAPGGGYIAASANTIPECVKPDNFQAMINAIREFGEYPIKAAVVH
jgi:uroporphyrinogen-III decarboxylase